MNNNVLKIIAGILLAGAIAVAILGIRLSQQPPAPATTPASAPVQVSTSLEAVVVAAHRIKAGQNIVAGDLAMKSLPSPAMQAYRQTQDVLGKTATSDIEPATILMPNLFVIATMANAVHPGERAVAVQIDEVVGIGGFARPGDQVDVLWYMPGNKETNESSSAQIILSGARILSMGDTTVMDVDTAQKAATVEKDALDKSGVKNAQEGRDRRLSMRSAVLAVPEADVTRLMVAVSSGQLRLALRPLDNKNATPTVAATKPERHLVTLNDLGPGGRKIVGGKESAVVIQEGSKERSIANTQTSLTP